MQTLTFEGQPNCPTPRQLACPPRCEKYHLCCGCYQCDLSSWACSRHHHAQQQSCYWCYHGSLCCAHEHAPSSPCPNTNHAVDVTMTLYVIHVSMLTLSSCSRQITLQTCQDCAVHIRTLMLASSSNPITLWANHLQLPMQCGIPAAVPGRACAAGGVAASGVEQPE